MATTADTGYSGTVDFGLLKDVPVRNQKLFYIQIVIRRKPVFGCAVLCCAVLRCAALCCAVLCCARILRHSYIYIGKSSVG
jgi:hypothetical protein